MEFLASNGVDLTGMTEENILARFSAIVLPWYEKYEGLTQYHQLSGTVVTGRLLDAKTCPALLRKPDIVHKLDGNQSHWIHAFWTVPTSPTSTVQEGVMTITVDGPMVYVNYYSYAFAYRLDVFRQVFPTIMKNVEKVEKVEC
jgi:hypothetical protein